SLETALKLADGLAVGEFADGAAGTEHTAGERKTAKIHDRRGPQRLLFSEKIACPVSGFTIPEIQPRPFSFNNPFRARPARGGPGARAAHRPRSRHSRPRQDVARRRDRAVGEIEFALLHADAARAWQALQVQPR